MYNSMPCGSLAAWTLGADELELQRIIPSESLVYQRLCKRIDGEVEHEHGVPNWKNDRIKLEGANIL